MTVALTYSFSLQSDRTSYASLFGACTAEKTSLTEQLVKSPRDACTHYYREQWNPREADIAQSKPAWKKNLNIIPIEPLALSSLASFQFLSSSSWAAARAPAPCMETWRQSCAVASSPFPKWMSWQELHSARGKQHPMLYGQWACPGSSFPERGCWGTVL